MLIAGEDEDFEPDLDSKDDDDLASQLTTTTNNHLTLMKLSMFSLGGITAPCTMKLRGHISDIEVIVMVDSGASHYFINYTTVDKLGMPVTYAGIFGVRLGTGSLSLSIRACHAVNIQLGST